jgi:hypothetical protein
MFVIYIVDISKNMTSLMVRTRCNRRLKRPVVTFCQKRAVVFPFEKREDVSIGAARARGGRQYMNTLGTPAIAAQHHPEGVRHPSWPSRASGSARARATRGAAMSNCGLQVCRFAGLQVDDVHFLGLISYSYRTIWKYFRTKVLSYLRRYTYSTCTAVHVHVLSINVANIARGT